MALPVVGGEDYPPFRPSGGPYYPAKRRTADAVDDDHHHHHYDSRHKRPKYVQQTQFAGPVAFKAAAVDEPLLSYTPLHHPHPRHRYPSPLRIPLPHITSPEPAGTVAAAPAMERTASGHSICPDPVERCASTELLDDRQAAQRVRDHLASFRRRNPDSKHERILRSIINPRPPPRRHHHHHRHRQRHHHHHGHHHHAPHQTHHPHSAKPPSEEPSEEENYPLDNAALESIFSAANEIFFNGRLSQRVSWDWSHSSASRYDSRVIGTTALRRAAAHTRGFETLVVLSSTILKDPRYSRRLLISTFLHELIHCYLFICCGFRARWCGGHTEGFRTIAGVIDEWIGEGGGGLFLTRVEADLELFRVGGDREGCCGRGEGEMGTVRAGGEEGQGTTNVYPCSGMAVEHEEFTAAAPATTGTGTTQEMVYFHAGGGVVPGQEAGVYFGRGSSSPSPGPRSGTPTHQAHYSDRAAGGGGGNPAWWRQQRRGARPLYVYSGDGPAPAYVYSLDTTTGPRP